MGSPSFVFRRWLQFFTAHIKLILTKMLLQNRNMGNYVNTFYLFCVILF
jgi:hypothetical protein